MFKVLCSFLLLTTFMASAFAAPEFWNTPHEIQAPFPQTRLRADESTNFHPGINLHPVAAQLIDLFGSRGNQLCAPTAIVNAINFLKYVRIPNFPQLARVPDMDRDGQADTYADQIRYFFASCKTNREQGTYSQDAIACMKKYLQDSGYTPWTYIVGPHATEASARVPVNVDHIRYYVGGQAAVLMGVGWYRFNPAKGMYERQGGHFFNVFGYDYNFTWGQEKIILKSVNSWIDYSGRSRANMYDDVSMNRLKDTAYFPAGLHYSLSGPGFTFNDFRAVVENIYMMMPAP